MLYLLTCRLNGASPVLVNHYMDIEGQGSQFGRQTARALWGYLALTTPPKSVDEAMNRRAELHIPAKVVLGLSKKGYLEITRW